MLYSGARARDCTPQDGPGHYHLFPARSAQDGQGWGPGGVQGGDWMPCPSLSLTVMGMAALWCPEPWGCLSRVSKGNTDR